MDTLAHALWSYILFFSHKLKWWAVGISIFPDIIAFTPHLFLEHFVGKQIMFDNIYHLTHSFISVIFVGLIVYFVARKYLILLGAWAFHIFMDIFTHSFEYYQTPYLYPFTSPFMFALNYKTITFTICNYILIALVLGVIVYSRQIMSLWEKGKQFIIRKYKLN